MYQQGDGRDPGEKQPLAPQASLNKFSSNFCNLQNSKKVFANLQNTKKAGFDMFWLVFFIAFSFDKLFKDPIFKSGQILKSCELGLQDMNFRGTQFNSDKFEKFHYIAI